MLIKATKVDLYLKKDPSHSFDDAVKLDTIRYDDALNFRMIRCMDDTTIALSRQWTSNSSTNMNKER